MWAGDQDAIVREVEEFLQDVQSPSEPRIAAPKSSACRSARSRSSDLSLPGIRTSKSQSCSSSARRRLACMSRTSWRSLG